MVPTTPAHQRRGKPEHQQNAASDLGDAGRPRVQQSRPHTEAFEPARGSRDASTADDVVPAVREKDDSESDAENG
jgi:hypothetical protein